MGSLALTQYGGTDMQFHPKTMAAIEAHALAEYPRECCGLIVASGGRRDKYVPCRNVAATANEHFILHPGDYAEAEDKYGPPVALVHSHPDAEAAPSDADRVACEEMAIPWLIVSVREGAIDGQHLLQPEGWQAPLLGRPFYHGILDCYTLLRDFYKRELSIELADYPRGDSWWTMGENLYVDNYQREGFRQLRQGEAIQYGDIVFMALKSDVPNHAGVFLGDVQLKEQPFLHKVPDAMLHHLYGRLSERVVYGGYWAEVTRMVIRHKEMEK